MTGTGGKATMSASKLDPRRLVAEFLKTSGCADLLIFARRRRPLIADEETLANLIRMVTYEPEADIVEPLMGACQAPEPSWPGLSRPSTPGRCSG